MASDELRPDIAAAKERMRTKLGAGKEIKKLLEHLHEGETVHTMLMGSYGRGQGLLVLTDRRLLFVKEGAMSRKSEDFPFEKVNSLQWSSGLAMGTIIIFAAGNKAEIKNVDKTAGKELADLVRQRIASPSAPTGASAAPSIDVADQLRKLGELRDAGILTDEEFTAKKAENLSRM